MDSDNESSESALQEQELTHQERRQARTRDAGRTPARRRLPDLIKEEAHEDQPSDLQPKEEETFRRPRMSVRLDAAEEPEDDVKSRETDAYDDPFQPQFHKFGFDVDYQKMHHLREQLFQPIVKEESPMAMRSKRPDDEEMVDIYAEEAQPDEPYDMFSPTKEDLDVEEGETSDEEQVPESVRLGDAFPLSVLPFPIAKYSIAAGREHVFRDTGLMLGRSSRFSFSHSSLMASSKYGAKKRNAVSQLGFAVEMSPIYSHLLSSRESLSRLLYVHCFAWYSTFFESVEKERPGVRVPSLEHPFKEGAVSDATIEQIIGELHRNYEEGDDNAQHARIAFWLLVALYKSEGELDIDQEDTLLLRLSRWAKGPAGTAFDEISEGPPLRKALIGMALGDTEIAVDIALENGYMRLALLMARALEAPKEDLRQDAEAQLIAYGILQDEEEGDSRENENRWDLVLENCEPDSPVSIDERMILLILAGHVSPVARCLDFSWYRVFIMELLHGTSSSEETQAERVSAAVRAIGPSKIDTLAPHRCTDDVDVVYHLLRLYSDPSTKYPITSGVYSNSSFGPTHRPLDSRYSWLLHQVLSSLIPQASTKNAPALLADAFSTQLRACGLPLWGFYVLCSGGAAPNVLKSALLRDWPAMRNDDLELTSRQAKEIVLLTKQAGDAGRKGEDGGEECWEAGDEGDDDDNMNAEKFLTAVLGVPMQWINEANAVAARGEGNSLDECRFWIACGTEDGARNAHDLLAKNVVPEIIVSQQEKRYEAVTEMLGALEGSKNIANWSTAGGILLSYMRHILGVPKLQKAGFDTLRGMAFRLGPFSERAKTNVQRHSASIMADGIASAQRAVLLTVSDERRDAMLDMCVEDLKTLPCSRGVELRIAGEYRVEKEHGRSMALRFAAGFQGYAKYVAVKEEDMEE